MAHYTTVTLPTLLEIEKIEGLIYYVSSQIEFLEEEKSWAGG